MRAAAGTSSRRRCGVLAAVVVVVAIGGCATTADHDAATPARPSPSASGPSPTTTASVATTTTPMTTTSITTTTSMTTTTSIATPPFEVRTVRHTIVDEARGRRLDTVVHHPAGFDGAVDRTVDRTVGRPFPLVLMAHGYRLPADGYERMVRALAARGYVVAAPDFPHTSSNGGDGNRGDIVNQPADLVAVLDAVVGGVVPGVPAIERPDRVAVMGHSDGGLTASALAFNTQYRDQRIAAAVVMTGGRALFPGSYFAPGSPPLLTVHGTADETNPISASVSLWRDLPSGIPDYLVRVDGGTHLGPYMFDTGLPALGDVVADFLDAHLGPTVDPSAIERLQQDAARAPLSIETR